MTEFVVNIAAPAAITFLFISGIIFWILVAVVAWKAAFGKLEGRRWLRFDLRSMFVVMTAIGIAAGLAVVGRHIYICHVVIRALDQSVRSNGHD